MSNSPFHGLYLQKSKVMTVSETDLNRTQILEKIADVLDVQKEISGFIGTRLCDHCETPEEEWIEKRGRMTKHLQALMKKYTFSARLPRNDLGISALAVLSFLLQIQNGFAQVLIMIDMIRGEAFGEVYMDSITSISKKMNQQLTALMNLVKMQNENSEEAANAFEAVLRLEREIDEDNIIICRQISVTTDEGTGYTCYIMRKIVSKLEHISDFAKELAEIIVDI